METSICEVHSPDVVVTQQLEGGKDHFGWFVFHVEHGVVLDIFFNEADVELVTIWAVSLLVEWQNLIRD